MAVDHSQDETTAEAVNPVFTLRLAVMNISVLRLSSPTVRFNNFVTNTMTAKH